MRADATGDAATGGAGGSLAPARARAESAAEDGPSGGAASRTDGDGPVEPCLRCGVRLPLRQMGCKGGHCPNCAHPYPHGDCSD